MATPNPDERIELFLRKPETIERFAVVLGKSANAFISSALILINSDPNLQQCTTISLYKSILRAASLELSLDQSLRQAWIIARRRKVKATKDKAEHYIMEAGFQPHYNGLRNLAERTGKYWVINVSPVYEGQTVWLDQLTGLHNVMLDSGLLTMPEQVNRLLAGKINVTDGAPRSKVIGYLGYYKTKKGVEKTVYMSIREIHEHAQKWAAEAYENKYGAWKDPKKLPTMEMKTVFLQLTKTMDLSGKESESLRDALKEDDEISETVTVAAEDAPSQSEPVAAVMTYEQAQELRIETPWGSAKAFELSRDKINDIYHSDMLTDSEREALALILKTEYQAEPPEMPKRTHEQNMRDLGH